MYVLQYSFEFVYISEGHDFQTDFDNGYKIVAVLLYNFGLQHFQSQNWLMLEHLKYFSDCVLEVKSLSWCLISASHMLHASSEVIST